MTLWIETLMRKEIVLDYLSTDEQLQGQSREHVQTKAEPCNVNERVVRREIVEDISLRFVGEYEVSRDCQRATSEQRDQRGCMSDSGKTIEGWGPQTSIDEEGIVMTDKRKTDDTDCLEYPRVHKGES